MHTRLILSTLILLTACGCYDLQGQGRPDPVFSTFKGPVYKMPIIKQPRGKGFTIGIVEHYDESVKDYDVIMDIELETPDIPNSDSVDGFPGHPQLKTQYAMLLDSEMTIKVPGCYQFRLKSDDGSILWIDDRKVVDNDGGHAMTTKTDSISLQPGTYPITLWYFQGHAAKFGIQLDSKLLGLPELCPVSAEPVSDIRLDFRSDVLFDSGSYDLLATAGEEMKGICNEIRILQPKKIQIYGHTDDIGTAENNQVLSFKRAETISNTLKKCLSGLEIEIHAIGKGESAPLTDNDSEENRSKNRRVEIIIKQ